MRETTTVKPWARSKAHGVELHRQGQVRLVNGLSRLGDADGSGVDPAVAGINEDGLVAATGRRRERDARARAEPRRGHRISVRTAGPGVNYETLRVRQSN